MAFRSLRSQLLGWTIIPLSLIAALDVGLSYRSALDISTLAQEVQLVGSARMIAEQVNWSDGMLSVSIPPAALELFDTPAGSGLRDHVFYRVSASDGRLLSGYFEMQVPAGAVEPGSRRYFDTVMRDEPVHAVAYVAPVLASPRSDWVLIEVGQTLRTRHAFAAEIWRRSAADHLMILAAASVLIVLTLRYSLSAIVALRDQVLGRQPGALEPLDPGPIPSELKPLVAAINDYVGRLGRQMAEHDRFIADASHQLRTPLTVFGTQVGYALQQADPREKDAALRGLRKGLRRMTRLVAQLLAYAETSAGAARARVPERAELDAVVRQVLEDHALLAQDRGIDLGFEAAPGLPPVPVGRHGLTVLVANLVDNALRYTPEGGAVTVRAAVLPSGAVRLTVEDDGPGIAPAERERVFERFYRLHGEDQPGSGLGLAIVREIAGAAGLRLSLGAPEQGTGTVVSVDFPAPPPPAA